MNTISSKKPFVTISSKKPLALSKRQWFLFEHMMGAGVALASHQYGAGSNPEPRVVIMWVEFAKKFAKMLLT